MSNTNPLESTLSFRDHAAALSKVSSRYESLVREGRVPGGVQERLNVCNSGRRGDLILNSVMFGGACTILVDMATKSLVKSVGAARALKAAAFVLGTGWNASTMLRVTAADCLQQQLYQPGDFGDDLRAEYRKAFPNSAHLLAFEAVIAAKGNSGSYIAAADFEKELFKISQQLSPATTTQQAQPAASPARSSARAEDAALTDKQESTGGGFPHLMTLPAPTSSNAHRSSAGGLGDAGLSYGMTEVEGGATFRGSASADEFDPEEYFGSKDKAPASSQARAHSDGTDTFDVDAGSQAPTLELEEQQPRYSPVAAAGSAPLQPSYITRRASRRALLDDSKEGNT